METNTNIVWDAERVSEEVIEHHGLRQAWQWASQWAQCLGQPAEALKGQRVVDVAGSCLLRACSGMKTGCQSLPGRGPCISNRWMLLKCSFSVRLRVQ